MMMLGIDIVALFFDHVGILIRVRGVHGQNQRNTAHLVL